MFDVFPAKYLKWFSTDFRIGRPKDDRLRQELKIVSFRKEHLRHLKYDQPNGLASQSQRAADVTFLELVQPYHDLKIQKTTSWRPFQLSRMYLQQRRSLLD